MCLKRIENIFVTIRNLFVHYTLPKVLTRRTCLINQELLKLVIISFILMALAFDSGGKLYGEIRCWSFLMVKGLSKLDWATAHLPLP